jgi:hypothetical protein
VWDEGEKQLKAQDEVVVLVVPLCYAKFAVSPIKVTARRVSLPCGCDGRPCVELLCHALLDHGTSEASRTWVSKLTNDLLSVGAREPMRVKGIGTRERERERERSASE